MSSVKITGLHHSVSETDLSSAYGDHTAISSIRILTSDKPNGPNHGFINFKTPEAAQMCVRNMSGLVVNGQSIHCSIQRPKGRPVTAHSVYAHPVKVGNLTSHVTDQQLRELFSRCGTIINVEMKNGNPPYAFVNFKDENGALRAVQTYHHEMQWNTRLTIVKKDSRSVSVSDDSPISLGPRSSPAVPSQASPNAASPMVAEGGQFRVDKPRRILHCAAPSQEEAQRQLKVVPRLQGEPDSSNVSMELPPDKKKYLDLKQRQILDDVMRRCRVTICLAETLSITGHEAGVAAARSELQSLLSSIMTESIRVTHHFKLERPLHARYSEVKAKVERSLEVLVNIPAVEEFFRGGRSGQTSVIVCVAKNQHHLYQAVEQIKAVDTSVHRLEVGIASQDGSLLKEAISSRKIDVKALKANVHVQQDVVSITALSTAEATAAQRAIKDLLESEKDGNDIFAFRDSNIGCLALECRMHELQALAQQYKVRIERKDPYGQNSHLVVTGKRENVKQCLANMNAWESALRLHKEKIQLSGMDQTALSECERTISDAARQCHVQCSLDAAIAQLEAASKRTVSPQLPSLSVVQPSQASPAGIVWEWKDDDGWKPYDQISCSGIDNAKKNGGIYQFRTIHSSYTVDPVAMTQTNDATGYKRQVRALASGSVTSSGALSHSGPGQWQYKDDYGQFVNYEQSLNDKLEHASRSGTDQVSFSTANNSYIVLLSRQRQYNEKTMKSREIRHVSGSVPAVGASVPQAANKFNHTFSPIQSGVLKHTMTVSVLGLSGADVQSFQTKFHKTISKSMEKPKKVPVPTRITERMLSSLHAVSVSHLVELVIEANDGAVAGTSAGENIVQVTGSIRRVGEAETKILTLVVEAVKRAGAIAPAPADAYPRQWQVQSQDLELFEVSMTSTEFRDIDTRMRDTLPNARLLKLERIQNKFLWRKYDQRRKEIAEKNSTKSVREELLFHGTRGADPVKVYKNNVGFDMRFSSQGLWGRANYFAKNASYSDRYSHACGGGQKQMFMAKVAIGDCVSLPSTPSLTMPPVHKADASSVIGDIPYDSVAGDTNGCRVYMTYENNYAYPFYLITYSIH